MSGLIRINADELNKLSNQTNEQRDNVVQVRSAIEQAVNDTRWQSDAFTSLRGNWEEQSQILKQLQQHLQAWGDECRRQVGPANRVNEPFR